MKTKCLYSENIIPREEPQLKFLNGVELGVFTSHDDLYKAYSNNQNLPLPRLGQDVQDLLKKGYIFFKGLPPTTAEKITVNLAILTIPRYEKLERIFQLGQDLGLQLCPADTALSLGMNLPAGYKELRIATIPTMHFEMFGTIYDSVLSVEKLGEINEYTQFGGTTKTDVSVDVTIIGTGKGLAEFYLEPADWVFICPPGVQEKIEKKETPTQLSVLPSLLVHSIFWLFCLGLIFLPLIDQDGYNKIQKIIMIGAGLLIASMITGKTFKATWQLALVATFIGLPLDTLLTHEVITQLRLEQLLKLINSMTTWAM